MLTVPANVIEKGEVSVVSTHTSDMIELVSGVCKVGLYGPLDNCMQCLPVLTSESHILQGHRFHSSGSLRP